MGRVELRMKSTSTPAPNKACPVTRDGRRVSRRVKDVVKQFERQSRQVRVPFRDRLRYWLYYVALAHRGESVFSATHDSVYKDGFFKRGYDKYCEKINRRLARHAQVETVQAPAFSRDELGQADYRYLTRKRVPYLIRDAAKGLAVKDWTLEYLEGIGGACTGPINTAPDQPSKDLDRPTKAHNYYDFRIGTLSEVADSIRSGGNLRFTVAQDVMHFDDERLSKDLDFGHWERMTGWDLNQHHWLRSRLYIGKIFSAQLLVQPEGAFSLWHTEPGDSFFVLARGVKDWTLAHPMYSAAMRPRVKTTTNYTGSNIDLRESDDVLSQRGFAGYLGIPKVRVRMQPGDLLRLPNFWWHTVQTLPGDYTLASSMRVEPGPNLVGAGLMLMRVLDKQAHAILKAYTKEGRISDSLIGRPRKSRTLSQ